MAATRTGCRAPGVDASARRCARSRPPSAPAECSTTTSIGSTRRPKPAPEPTSVDLALPALGQIPVLPDTRRGAWRVGELRSDDCASPSPTSARIIEITMAASSSRVRPPRERDRQRRVRWELGTIAISPAGSHAPPLVVRLPAHHQLEPPAATIALPNTYPAGHVMGVVAMQVDRRTRVRVRALPGDAIVVLGRRGRSR
jgi:hypothetical protein